MIRAHGFKKIAQTIELQKPSLKIGDLVYMEWPGHFGLDVCRRSEDSFEITLYDAKQIDAVSFMTEMNALKHG